MQKTMGVTKLQRGFHTFFQEVVHKRVQLVLTRGSRPEAVLIPYEDYLNFNEMQENEVLGHFDQIWERLAQVNAAHSPEEIAADVESARKA